MTIYMHFSCCLPQLLREMLSWRSPIRKVVVIFVPTKTTFSFHTTDTTPSTTYYTRMHENLSSFLGYQTVVFDAVVVESVNRGTDRRLLKWPRRDFETTLLSSTFTAPARVFRAQPPVFATTRHSIALGNM